MDVKTVEDIVRRVVRNEIVWPRISRLTTQDIAGGVRAEAGRRNISRTELADLIGVSRPTVGYALNGQRDFTLTELAKIAEVFGIDVDTLLASAMLGSGHVGPFEVEPEPVDTWAQPPRAKQRRGKAYDFKL